MAVNLWRYIGINRRWQLFMLLFLTLLTSLAEVISLGAVLPFIGVLTQPDKVFLSPWLSALINWVGINSSSGLVFLLAIGFALAALLAGGLRLLLLWAGVRLGNAIGADLSIEIYRRTLYQNYSVHIARSSSEIISGITQKAGVATGVVISLVTLLTSAMIFISILLTLIVINPLASIIAASSFGFAYSIIAMMTSRRLTCNGQSIARQQTQTIKALQEGLGAIRDILLDGAQKIYCDIYKNAIVSLQKANAENTFINQAPRYVMEAIGMALVACFVLVLNQSNGIGGVQAALPILALLGLGAQRLLPLMQQLYANWSNILGNKAVVIDVLDLLNQPLKDAPAINDSIDLIRSIRFENVGFKYSETAPWVIDEVSFVIPKGARVGIIGSTGSGKSTLLDLLMGLLEPTKGKILLDDRSLDAYSCSAWQMNLAHVPQSIFLTDNTIAENIALGVPKERIDLDRVKIAAQQAMIDNFIEATPDGYDTIVGERGVRLSGGQRQRVGIARALYKQASVLIFDEATSALDTTTETSVMEAIEGLNKDLTILIIAHRFSTLKNCSLIIELGHGKIKRKGSYHELCSHSPAD